MKTFSLILFILTSSFIIKAQDTQSENDTIYCEIYFCLNDQDAVNYYFNLYLNDIFINKLTHGNRLIYKMYSQGIVLISDDSHKPFATIQAKPNSKYYFRICKSFGGRYFKLEEYKTKTEIQEYLHFYFWEKYYKYGGPSLIDQVSNTTDKGTTLEMKENPLNPICTTNR